MKQRGWPQMGTVSIALVRRRRRSIRRNTRTSRLAVISAGSELFQQVAAIAQSAESTALRALGRREACRPSRRLQARAPESRMSLLPPPLREARSNPRADGRGAQIGRVPRIRRLSCSFAAHLSAGAAGNSSLHKSTLRRAGLVGSRKRSGRRWIGFNVKREPARMDRRKLRPKAG